MDVKRKLGFAEFAFAPVPAAEGVFFGFEVDAIEELEGLAYAIEVLSVLVVITNFSTAQVLSLLDRIHLVV